MKGQYGWLKPYGDIDHSLAGNHGGHIFVHKQDIAYGHVLSAGDGVTFFLYMDGKGLGAEVCKSINHSAAVQDAWQPTMSWNMPLTSTMVVPADIPSRSTPQVAQHIEHVAVVGALPSVGSANHGDGSCKRCAFFPKGRCTNGADCAHCHFDHTGRTRLRTRKPRVQGKHVPELPSEKIALAEDVCHSAEDAEENEVEVPAMGHNKVATAGNTVDDEESPEAAERVIQLLKKDKLLQALKLAEDYVSECDTGDIATVAPSSSYSSDDEEGSLGCSSGESPVLKGTPSFGSEKSRSRSVSFELEEEQEPAPFSCLLSTSEESDSQPESEKSEPLSPMSWSAQQRLRRAGASGDVVSPAEIGRKARALLNKLTHDRFESLCTQILALPISTPEHLASLAAEIFGSSTTQGGFRSLYAELCMRLDAHFAGQSTSIGGKTFRKVLVSECQASFERSLEPADPALFEGLSGDEQFELEMKLKTRRLGNMGFIGELLVRRLLAQKLMPPIILELLSGDEVALESLVAFLTVVAPCFDRKASLYQAHLHDAFATLRRKKNEKGLSTRMRCHLSDLFDARANGWVAPTV